MIKTLTAYTEEVDDIDVAIEEILSQLDLEANKKKNSIGIVACHYEFIFSGVVKAISERLSFDVIGAITPAQASGDKTGLLALTLLVLTSDDVEFGTAISDSLLGDFESSIKRAYIEAAAGHEDRPALILVYAGFLLENSGDEYIRVLTEISGDAPTFGTLAVDDSADFHNSFAIHNGVEYRDSMALALIYGNVSPKFYLATISRDKILDKPALITESEGHILKEVNGRPVAEFFEALGLTQASETSYAMTSLPFMLDYNDGTPPVSKVFIALDENKNAICAGMMPKGSMLSIGVFDKEDVLLTTGNTMDQALEEGSGANGMLIYSCISRNMSLGGDQLLELELVLGKNSAAHDIPCLMAYSGGEMCPTQVSTGKAVNRFHNNTFIVCVF
ncbi:hypothetical protein AGMMS49983_04260 [Clostridia bacterium]|nr:hypothetical protein AGMMS49983_04260 [Clostridia bacterium]